MMDFGVLYPNLLAISVLPSSVALAAACAGLTPGLVRRDLASILALLLALAGLDRRASHNVHGLADMDAAHGGDPGVALCGCPPAEAGRAPAGTS